MPGQIIPSFYYLKIASTFGPENTLNEFLAQTEVLRIRIWNGCAGNLRHVRHQKLRITQRDENAGARIPGLCSKRKSPMQIKVS
jgi:hypothetical protein